MPLASKRRKKNLKKKSRVQGRKKHVETMFVTNKSKNYIYYHKPAKVFSTIETSVNKFNVKASQNKIYLKSLEAGYLTAGPLKAIIRVYKWFTKVYRTEKNISYRLFIFPDFVLTAKPKEMRMGKGKGAPSKKVSIIKKGQILMMIKFNSFRKCGFLIDYFIRKIVYKFPFKILVSTNNW